MKSYIKFSQGFESITINIDFKKTTSKNKLIGTSCNELFALIDLQKAGVCKVFKLSQPIDITIVGNEFEIDTCKIQTKLKSKLKLNATLESKIRFAKRFKQLFVYATTNRGLVDIDDIIKITND